MARRPDSIPEARRVMREALQRLNDRGMEVNGKLVTSTYCQDRPVPFADTRQTPEEAKKLCHRGEVDECPLIKQCEPLGFTESVYADDIVYGGYTWKRGLPVVSETKQKVDKAAAKEWKDRVAKEMNERRDRVTNGRYRP